MALISATRLRVRSRQFLPEFFWRAFLSARQARRSPGNLGARTIAGANHAFWTITAWENEAVMRSFMLAGAHRKAMPKLLEWCDEASVVHWAQDTPELPALEEVHRRMVAEGRMSKVNHPSADQQARRIPPLSGNQAASHRLP
jgi:hypothetical protein